MGVVPTILGQDAFVDFGMPRDDRI